MQPVEVAPELDSMIVAAAKNRSLQVARDTHYDAFNIELRWWEGNKLHRLDFQPLPEGPIEVTKLQDTYPLWGRFLWKLRQVIPMLPNVAKTEYVVLGRINPPFEKQEMQRTLNGYLERVA